MVVLNVVVLNVVVLELVVLRYAWLEESGKGVIVTSAQISFCSASQSANASAPTCPLPSSSTS